MRMSTSAYIVSQAIADHFLCHDERIQLFVVVTCKQNLQQCIMPVIAQFQGLSAEDIREQILTQGLENTCR